MNDKNPSIRFGEQLFEIFWKIESLSKEIQNLSKERMKDQMEILLL